MLRAHMTQDVDQRDQKEEEEVEDIQNDIYEEEDSRRDSSRKLQGHKMSYPEGSGSRAVPPSKHELC